MKKQGNVWGKMEKLRKLNEQLRKCMNNVKTNLENSMKKQGNV